MYIPNKCIIFALSNEGMTPLTEISYRIMVEKGFIKSEPTTIVYKGQEYPCKELTNIHGDVDYVATIALEEALGMDVDEWGDEECSVDGEIGYYLTEQEFNASDDEIAKVLNEAGCMIADPDAY